MAEKRVGRRDPEKEATWVERMKQWERSGLGPKDYCLRHNCKESQFHWWKRVLQARVRSVKYTPPNPAAGSSWCKAKQRGARLITGGKRLREGGVVAPQG